MQPMRFPATYQQLGNSKDMRFKSGMRRVSLQTDR